MANELCVTNLPSAGKFDDVCDNWWFDWDNGESLPHASFVKARECGSSQELSGLSLRVLTDQNASFSSSTAIEDKYCGATCQVPCMASELEREVAELEAAEQEAKADRVELELSSCTAGLTFDTSPDSTWHADTAAHVGRGRRDAEDDGMDTSSDQFVSDADPKTATSEEDETSAWHADSSLEGDLILVKPEPGYGPSLLPPTARLDKPRSGRIPVPRTARVFQRGPRRMHTVVSSNFGQVTSDEGMADADQGLEESEAWHPVDGEHSSGKTSNAAATAPHSFGVAAGGVVAKRGGAMLGSRLLAPVMTGQNDDMSEDGANECGRENDELSPGRSVLSGSNGGKGSRDDLLHASSPVMQERGDDDLEDGARPARTNRPMKMPIEGMTSPRGKKRASSSSKSGPAPGFHACTQCGTQTTPVWRAGPHGPKTLCNACGVRYMKIAKKR